MQASDHIVPDAKCCVCRQSKATSVTRLVTRDDTMDRDALLWGGATCASCAEALGRLLNAKTPIARKRARRG